MAARAGRDVLRLAPQRRAAGLLGIEREGDTGDAGHGIASRVLGCPAEFISLGRADPAGIVWAWAPTQSAIAAAIVIVILKVIDLVRYISVSFSKMPAKLLLRSHISQLRIMLRPPVREVVTELYGLCNDFGREGRADSQSARRLTTDNLPHIRVSAREARSFPATRVRSRFHNRRRRP
jgi:hypothetical protein